MTEHKQEPEIIIENKQTESLGGGNLIAGSIIVGAILISISIFYNTKLVLKQFVSGSAAEVTGQAGTAAAPSAPTGQAGAAGGAQGSPVSVKDRSGQAQEGNKNAKVVMYEFSDFQCPFCKQWENQVYSQLKSQYIDTGKIKFVYRNFPLTAIHVNAQKAAEASECANLQGKFWPYHDMLFDKSQADGTNLDVNSLKQYAKTLGLDAGKFNTCLDNGQATSAVSQDLADGQAVGVTGTPTFVINGKVVVGAQPFATFQQAIDAALGK